MFHLPEDLFVIDEHFTYFEDIFLHRPNSFELSLISDLPHD
jgi:hypothetical protein